MLFTNILVPYDGSSNAIHAFKIALDMAKYYASKITLVTCLEIDFRAPWYGYDSSVGKIIMKKQKEAAKKHISKLELIAKKAKTSFNSEIVVTKSIVKTIVDFSKSHKIDLIVMGSHGRKGFDKLLLGSVANGVSQKVKCPVLIIK
jgi:nucleotide-binding universal stress UspA family protein